MSFSAYSLTPSLNVTIGGVNVDEGCPSANINNAIRQLAADGKELNNTVAAIDISTLLPKAGGVMTDNITRSGSGTHLYYNSATLVDGHVDIVPTGTARPASPGEGYMRFLY